MLPLIRPCIWGGIALTNTLINDHESLVEINEKYITGSKKLDMAFFHLLLK